MIFTRRRRASVTGVRRRSVWQRVLVAGLWPSSVALLTACEKPHVESQTPLASDTVSVRDTVRGGEDTTLLSIDSLGMPLAPGADTPLVAPPSGRGGRTDWSARSRMRRPDSTRALYVNAWAAGSRQRMARLIALADSTEINAMIIDIKESDTYLTHSGTNIPLALEIGADGRPASSWLPALVDTLYAHNIFPIARIVVFKDRMLAEKKPELAIRHADGSVWKDNKGGPWVNPYDKRVWDYNIAIAREALDMGFAEVQWDYVRFPDVTNSARAVMRYPGSDGISRADNIRRFIAYSKEALAAYRVPITADVFGLVTHLEGDVEIGQNWEQVVSVADVVLPMVYPSHYASGLYGFARPIANPYEIVRLAVTDAAERTRYVRDSLKRPVGEVMPWLEAMSIRGATYGARELRLQIQATYDAGLKSWALWNPGSRYAEFEGAFRPSTGGLSAIERAGFSPPQWTLPRQRLSRGVQGRERPAPPVSTGDSLLLTGTVRPPNPTARPF
jgi:hypothetical protein